ncbi:regulator of G-protein signaling 7-like protein [Sarcoptes scabiei]|uniref:Regulator of G-protein signaling 7-like protein n=1 Tax=Sarcoptes scabiei TaxID=52283 RepID=A0A132ABX2_SARSC|nr:regulator of G-protein signaling 7-like protein [Sarcoptes scabiei]
MWPYNIHIRTCVLAAEKGGLEVVKSASNFNISLKGKTREGVDDVLTDDPLDATKEYSEGLTEFVTTMVCVARNGEPIIGVIHQPFESKTYWTSKFGIDKKLLNFGSIDHQTNQSLRIIISRSHSGNVKNWLQKNPRLPKNLTIIEAAGSGYKTLQLLKDNADIYLHQTYIKKWDICAPNVLLRYSSKGGVMTTLNGVEIDYGFQTDVLNRDAILVALSEASNSSGNNGDGSENNASGHCENWNPNQIVYNKMEQIIEKMQDEHTGVPVRTVKSFMSKIPSVFNGSDLIAWMIRELELDDQQEALHLANLMASHGYFFPIDDHPENTDYAVYLCKRTMQNKTRLELADYEAENLARLQKMFSRKWEFIFMQAEAQAKVDKKRDKLERKVLDSQERAFWDVHRPVPGSVNTTEIDIKKACRMNKPVKSSKVKISTVCLLKIEIRNFRSDTYSLWFCLLQHLACSVGGGRVSPINENEKIEILKRECDSLRIRLDHRIGGVKISKIAESYSTFYEQWAEYDPFVTPLEPSKGIIRKQISSKIDSLDINMKYQFPTKTPTNPWISDSSEFWEMERQTKDVPCRRVRRWAFSLKELLKDAAGREQFFKFLGKEFSAENLKFWDAVQELKCVHTKDVAQKVQEIWNEYLGSGEDSIKQRTIFIRFNTFKRCQLSNKYRFEIIRDNKT